MTTIFSYVRLFIFVVHNIKNKELLDNCKSLSLKNHKKKRNCCFKVTKKDIFYLFCSYFYIYNTCVIRLLLGYGDYDVKKQQYNFKSFDYSLNFKFGTILLCFLSECFIELMLSIKLLNFFLNV